MTVPEACRKLDCRYRKLQYILKAAGIPEGQRTRNGYLLPRAVAVVEARTTGGTVSVAPVVSAWQPDARREAVEELHAQFVQQQAELARVQADLTRALTYLESADALLGELVRTVARLERETERAPVRVTVGDWWRDLWAARQAVPAQAVAHAEFASTEIYYSERGGRVRA